MVRKKNKFSGKCRVKRVFLLKNVGCFFCADEGPHADPFNRYVWTPPMDKAFSNAFTRCDIAPEAPWLGHVSADELDMVFKKIPDTKFDYYYHLRVVAADDPTEKRTYACSNYLTTCFTENLSRMKPYNLSMIALYKTPDEGYERPSYPVESQLAPCQLSPNGRAQKVMILFKLTTCLL